MRNIFNQVVCEVEGRIKKILRNTIGIEGAELDAKVKEIMEPALALAENDFAREEDQFLSRATPVEIGEAFSLNIFTKIKNISTIKGRAKIYLVGANTDISSITKKLMVEMRQMRPYIPRRPEGRTDKSFHYWMKQRLWGMHENATNIVDDLVTHAIVRGKYVVKNPEHLAAAPRISVYYCNVLEDDRCVLMLRASDHKCQKASYEAYCQIVIGTLIARVRGGFMLDENNGTWKIKDNIIQETMCVTDQMLLDKAGKHEDDSLDIDDVDPAPPIDEKIITG